MKRFITALLLFPCFVHAQIETKITYNIPEGTNSNISFFTAESDAPVVDGPALVGPHAITISTQAPTTGFLYISSIKRFIPFTLGGTEVDLTPRLGLPKPGDDDLMGSSPEIFSAILQRFMNVTTSLKNLSYLPEVIKDSNAAREKVREYYRYLQGMVTFADSVVTLYPKDNASLFTVFRLAHWCSYSPEVYTILGKLDNSLQSSDFAKELLARKMAMAKDSATAEGKKPGTGLQMVVSNTQLAGAGAHKKMIIYWDDYSHLDNDLLDDIKRLHLLYGSKELQVNFVYTGTTKNWEPMIKQPGMPTFANYIHCNKADQLGSSPVITTADNSCVSSGIRGYYLYKKVSVD
jgi:hypothetical protein